MSVFICTREMPWREGLTASDNDQIRHDSLEEIGEQETGWPAGDIVTYRCKNCGHVWKAELPQ